MYLQVICVYIQYSVLEHCITLVKQIAKKRLTHEQKGLSKV